ncbi:MAG: hypothetical protein HY695_09425 [Deltaproteobacteria bacterium]|nr:hypothetical protein [Deltaproteobacteria bacterium]
MIAQWIKRLRGILVPAGFGDGRSRNADLADILRDDYVNLLRLADQVDDHAGKAPYPSVAARLREISAENRRTAAALKEKFPAVAGPGAEGTELPLKTGTNHWERMVHDLEDTKTLETRLFVQAVRLAEEAPEISGLLRDIASIQAHNKEIFIDLIARADPQANLS